MPFMRGRRIVLTSTNAARAAELSGGARNVHEILGKPYDLDAIVRAVPGAATGGDTSSTDAPLNV